ncbi:hypothetical protein BTO20_35425 [Mycobacterium dioxanotrophicus]|uniref:Uncharacterized protein n=1 Tax=Mycobacterium dioxanotrophicus TaxID=482462 RepID=A0A1Y0CDM3_9MYCO|nr:hypothetical protein BTO20_35425 [Mycobacterium dioxanotrophicus]
MPGIVLTSGGVVRLLIAVVRAVSKPSALSRSVCVVPALNVGSQPAGNADAIGSHAPAAAPPKLPAANRMLFRLSDESVMICV